MKRLVRSLAAGACAIALLAGCGREASTPSQHDPNAARSEETVRAGDISVRASAIQTRLLTPAIAQRYGAAHDERTVLVVVSLRKGDDATAVSLPAKVTVEAGDLLGRKQTVAMREMRDGELLDYVGVVTMSPPDTLRFDVVVVREDGTRHELRFNRDFF
ncbi:MAG: DUF4426 domain-containing protein [Lysobacter sp.]